MSFSIPTSEKTTFSRNHKDQELMQAVWRGARTSTTSSRADIVGTGYKALDHLITNNGWPLGVTTEFGLSQPGIGEMRLLLPALRALQQRSVAKRKVILISPPFVPVASSLLKEGLQIEHLTIVQPDTVSDVIWACEQALLSSNCAAVICWTGRYQLSNKESRRLQIAAAKNSVLHILLRDTECLKQASASHLRLILQITPKSELDIQILKQPRHWGGQKCTLSLQPHYEKWQRLPVTLLPHHNRQYNDAITQQIELASSTDQQTASVIELSSTSLSSTEVAATESLTPPSKIKNR